MKVCGNIVKGLVAGLFKSFNAFGLAGGDGTDGGGQCGVQSTCIVDKCVHDILDVFDILWAKWFR